MKQCPNCSTLLPPQARFCSNCGATQIPGLAEAGYGGINWNGDLLPAFLDFFWQRLEERIQAEQDLNLLAEYKELVFSSQYRDTVQRKLHHFVDQFSELILTDAVIQKEVYQKLLYLTDDLLDFFFILHASTLNVNSLSEKILKYHQTIDANDFRQMALDFMDFDFDNQPVYVDFIKMPVRKLRNASKQFLFPEQEELIWFIYDQTLLGSAKEGFAMTDRAIYWKSGLQGPQKVFYHKLQSLKKEKEWLLINDIYFNANTAINTRMIWLLRKLKRLN